MKYKVQDGSVKFMSIKEMRKHKWSINWSGGKDSTATIIACIKHGIPIKEINYVRMMFIKDIPATLPIMTDFVDSMIDIFRHKYNLTVNVIYSDNVMDAVANKVYKRSKYKQLNGKRYTLACLSRQGCTFSNSKVKALNKISTSDYELIGYACDEYKRIPRLQYPYKQSILCTLGVTEKECFDICRINGMLSPLYDLGLKRDGCWFCPNYSKKEMLYVKQNYPHFVNFLYDEFAERERDYLYPQNNSWVRQYFEDWEAVINT